MQFDFTDDQQALKQEVRRALGDIAGVAATRELMNGNGFDLRGCWQRLAELGWTGTAIAETHGGSALGYTELAGLAEEVGRSLTPLPVGSSLYLFANVLQHETGVPEAGDYLAGIANGSSIGTVAFAEGGMRGVDHPNVTIRDGRLTGGKWPVVDGAIADAALVTAMDPENGLVLCLVDLRTDGVRRSSLDSIDPSREMAKLEFDNVPAVPVGDGAVIARMLDHAAVLSAFEQIGGADVCLQTAVDYATERKAFGQPVGTYQGIKHKLARVYVKNEIARSNAYKALCALESNAASLPVDAAVARISALDAYAFAASESLHVHGGMGFTWEADCHLYLRRQQHLALSLGGASYWKPRLAGLTIQSKLPPLADVLSERAMS